LAEKLKILFLPRWYPNRYDPMPGLFIERHARAVAAHVRVGVLYVHKDDKLVKSRMEMEQLKDDELFQLKIYFRSSRIPVPFLRLLVDLFRYLKYHSLGFKILKKEFGTPDVIHVNVLTRLGMIALFYKWLSGTPYVLTEHWTRYLPHMDNFNGFLRKAVTRMVVRNASAVMPVTENLKKAMEMHRLKNKNWQVIPNVVDVRMFDISEKPSAGQHKKFIHVSCFEDRQKNISGILRVLKRLSEQRKDWTCQLVGEGVHLEQIVFYARELKLEEKLVVFAGLKEKDELAGMMADADFQVMFSRYENLPVVLLESLACGIPVISTDVGGINEHINSERGLLIRSEDEDELLESLNFMLDHAGEYNKKGIREYAVNHFSREVIGEQLFKVYSSIINH
jgi:glycosyltransferase involved in cell wall biosynthesis